MAVTLRLHPDAQLAMPGPSTAHFIEKYETLFEKKMVYSLREGAPLLQMLEAPEDFVIGSAEPWIVDVICALLKAGDFRNVLECGAFVGVTTQRLAETLAQMGGGRIVACELDFGRAQIAHARLEQAGLPPTVEWSIVQDDVLKYLHTIPDESISFAFVDDDHDQAHVYEELTLLLPKMASRGIVTGHDVHGSTALHEVFAKFPNSISLDLPRLGPAGGLGLLQVP